MSTPAPKKKVKKKSIRDVEIGDHVRETASSRGKKRCGEVLMILQDNPGDPTLECVEVHPDELTPLEKGSDGLKTFKAKRSKLKLYTPRKQLFKKKTFEKGDVIRHKRGGTFRYGRIVCFVHPDGLLFHLSRTRLQWQGLVRVRGNRQETRSSAKDWSGRGTKPLSS